ncbi:MAG: peptidylprolyl isomerase [Tenuifilaceae bacterium]
MATLEKLRTRAGVLLAIVIGIALFSFILGDFVNPGKSIFNQSQHELAKIDGKSIPYQLYQGKVEETVEIRKMLSGENNIDEQTTEGIREQVWQQIVRETVMEDEYNSLGVAVHPDELFDMVQGRNIHPTIQQLFGNPQTGEIDKAVIVQFLKRMDEDPTGRQKVTWLFIENEIKTDRLFTKYANLIRKGLYATNLESQKSLLDRTDKVDFKYAVAQYYSIPDSTVKYTKADIEKYYNSHLNEYEQKTSRDIDYVIFPIKPSEDDIKLTEEWINKIMPEFKTVEEPKQYVTLNSDTPFDGKNYNKGELPVEYSDWAFSAKVGEMTGPFFDGNSYKLVKIADIKFLPDSVKVRHILITPAERSNQSALRAKSTADSLLSVIKKGGNFASIANEYSQDPGSAEKGGDLGWFKEGMMVQQFNDACFSSKKGEYSVVETPYGFHIINVLDKGKDVKKVQVAVLERKITSSSKTIQNIYTEASQFAGTNTTKEQFNKAIDEKKLTKRIASNLLENDRRIAGLDNPRELVRWAYEAKLGNVSKVFELGDNFVVATLTEIREEGSAPIDQVRDEIIIKVIKEKKADILSEKIQSAIKSSQNIEDIAQNIGSNVEQASGISFSSFSLPNAGVEPAVIATAAFSQEGKLVGPIVGNSGVYALTVTAINKETGDIEGEKNRLKGSFGSRAYYEAYEALKKDADIKDKRAKFY